jgi:hypothetical protein
MRPARDNPFATHRVLREHYRLDEAGWAALLAQLESLGRRGAINGPHGAGKTTLLEDLAVRLEARGWRVTLLRLSEETPRIPGGWLRSRSTHLDRDDFLLVDGAEQLPPWSWWLYRWHARRAGGLVVTTHRPGRLPTLHQCVTTPELLGELAGALGGRVTDDDARELHARHRGNLRDALRELYDRSAAGLI